MHLPVPRGPLSSRVVAVLSEESGDHASATSIRRSPCGSDLLHDEDFQLGLWILFEQHFRGFDDVDPDLEWDPLVLHARSGLEARLEEALRELTAADVRRAHGSAHSLEEQLTGLIDDLDGGSLAGFLHRHASRGEFADFLRQRSIYHLKESDPQSFVLPRIDGPAKVALAELQYDEYGAGAPDRLHARMFADALDAMGLDSAYGAYIDETTAITLAVNNVMSMFALRRRLRGAALGHLAAFEATSSVPCRRIAAGAERLGLPAATGAYFDEHIEADAAHEQIAIGDICATLADAEPLLADDILFGAACCLRLDEIAGDDLLATWQETEVHEDGTRADLRVLA